ncbi:MAG: hypothetical protein M1814_006267 [Vezdaea aestivalis]|nr:MAG: hypothetical protein M1814_006267 [Vezdaea aestivalis]
MSFNFTFDGTTMPAIDPTAGNTLEVDHSDGSDSTYGDSDGESYTTSIASSMLKYREENGRTYHIYKDGSYILPNDETENDRLDLQHQLFLLTLKNKLCLAPIKHNPPHVIDIGTGTGIWALDFADENPGSQVIGNDLSAIQPSFVPPNLQFLVDDAEETWTYNQKFDLVHARMMVGSIKDWPKFYKQAYDNMTPGGWVEIHDMSFPVRCDDNTLPKTSALSTWCELILEASRKFGSEIEEPLKYSRYMQDAGFVNVHEVRYKWPINAWPRGKEDKELGAWAMQNFLDGLQGFSLALMTRLLGWSAEEVEVLLVKVRDDLRNRRMHGYWFVHVVYGQRPEKAPVTLPADEQPSLEKPTVP